MAQLDYLIAHCSATRAGQNITAQQVLGWHLAKWDRPGYADIIELDGNLVNLTPYNTDNKVDPWEITWGAKGVNYRSRHFCYIGGLAMELVKDDDGVIETLVPADTRTPEQLYAQEIYVKYMILRHPNIKFAGHNQFSKKACPSYDTIKWAEAMGIPSKNIYYG
jgi:N-acetylmuramoyl-L-alanine amidase